MSLGPENASGGEKQCTGNELCSLGIIVSNSKCPCDFIFEKLHAYVSSDRVGFFKGIPLPGTCAHEKPWQVTAWNFLVCLLKRSSELAYLIK